MRILPVKSKKGITLVETVIAVVVLAILAAGVLTMLSVAAKMVSTNTAKGKAHSEAMQQLDLAISAISNGSSTYLVTTEDDFGNTIVALDTEALKTEVGLKSGVSIAPTVELHDDTVAETNSNVRGWYLSLTYKGATVTGFASNTRGVFD